MTDIIEQAEAALEAVKLTGNDPASSVGLINSLLVALKAAHAEVEREHLLFTQEAAATNRRLSEAWQAGFVEGKRR
jgi:hypothetical protein